MNQEKSKKDRKFCGVWYPEDNSHCRALEYVIQNYKCAYILHDKDCDEYGELKKPHWHVVFTLENGASPRYSSAIAKELEIEENYVQCCKKVDSALKYLIHIDNPEKYQYDVDEVYGELKIKLKEVMQKGSESEGERVNELLEYIVTRDEKITMLDFSRYCAINGYWDVFRRSGAIFIKIIDEHNNKYCQNDVQ